MYLKKTSTAAWNPHYSQTLAIKKFKARFKAGQDLISGYNVCIVQHDEWTVEHELLAYKQSFHVKTGSQMQGIR